MNISTATTAIDNNGSNVVVGATNQTGSESITDAAERMDSTWRLHRVKGLVLRNSGTSATEGDIPDVRIGPRKLPHMDSNRELTNGGAIVIDGRTSSEMSRPGDVEVRQAEAC